MFRKREEATQDQSEGVVERVTSVLGDGINLSGRLTGRGGIRIEGAFEGEIVLNGLLVIGTTGRVTCKHVQANTVIVAGALRGNITADKVEVRSTGRIWGDVTTRAFTTEEGAFLRGQIQMEEQVELDIQEDELGEVNDSEIILRQEKPALAEDTEEQKSAPKPKPKTSKKKPKTKKKLNAAKKTKTE